MIRSLQGIRFIFALLIFLHHLIIPEIGCFGTFPVTFFFILSGFVLTAGYGQKVLDANFSYLIFFKRRFQKIYPIHIITFFIALIIILATHIYARVETDRFVYDLLVFVPNLLLIHSWIPIKEIYFSGNVVSWFIADTFFFYAVYPYLYKFLHRSRLCILLLVIIYVCTSMIVPSGLQHAIIYVNPLVRLVDFSLGIALYDVYHNFNHLVKNNSNQTKPILATVFEIMAISVSVFSLFLSSLTPFWIGCSILYWIPAFLLIMVFPMTEKWGGQFSKMLGSNVGQKLGAISFSFFMFHQLVIRIWYIFSSHLGLMDIYMNPWISSVILIPIILIISFYYQNRLEPMILSLFLRFYEK